MQGCVVCEYVKGVKRRVDSKRLYLDSVYLTLEKTSLVCLE